MNVSVPIQDIPMILWLKGIGLNQLKLRTLWGDKKVAIISKLTLGETKTASIVESLEKTGFQVVRFEFLRGSRLESNHCFKVATF